jgi:hypothetical protein
MSKRYKKKWNEIRNNPHICTKARSRYNDSASSLGTYDKKPVFNEGGGSVKNMQQFIR